MASKKKNYLKLIDNKQNSVRKNHLISFIFAYFCILVSFELYLTN